MRILGLCWRYLDHPAAGGAEVVTHQIFSRLVEEGHEVTSFNGSYPGAAPEDELDGVRLIRRGRQWSVHFLAWRWLRSRLDQFDIVIDQINTIPFFTPLYVPEEKRRFFFHQLAREYWHRETRGVFKLIAPIGYMLEPLMLKAYRGSRGVTASESSRRDLEALGFVHARVSLSPYPVDAEPLPHLQPKTGPFTVLMAGRLTPAKFVEEGVRAFGQFQRVAPGSRLEIVGSGDPAYRQGLERLVAELGIEGVTFHGRVSEKRKFELMRESHVHVFASHREGWGLVVGEAAAMGTPSIGYDAPGVRDSIAEPRMLAPIGDVIMLARLLERLHGDPKLYEKVRLAAWERAGLHSREAATEAFARALLREPAASAPSATKPD
jgi:glycosyltransferase involved in cell wall biosynthesis